MIFSDLGAKKFKNIILELKSMEFQKLIRLSIARKKIFFQ
jgi:hypothetical protein